jgi:hypothetical protein
MVRSRKMKPLPATPGLRPEQGERILRLGGQKDDQEQWLETCPQKGTARSATRRIGRLERTTHLFGLTGD